jgi:hypothetical protein
LCYLDIRFAFCVTGVATASLRAVRTGGGS